MVWGTKMHVFSQVEPGGEYEHVLFFANCLQVFVYILEVKWVTRPTYVHLRILKTLRHTGFSGYFHNCHPLHSLPSLHALFLLFSHICCSMNIKMNDPRGAATLRGEMNAERHLVLNVTTGLSTLVGTILERQNHSKKR